MTKRQPDSTAGRCAPADVPRDLAQASDEELRQLIKAASDHLARRDAERKREAMAKIRMLAKEHGLNVAIDLRPANAAAPQRRSETMTFRNMILTKFMGRLVMERDGDALRLEGHYPNPEKGHAIFRGRRDHRVAHDRQRARAVLWRAGKPAGKPGRAPGDDRGRHSVRPRAARRTCAHMGAGRHAPDLQGWGFGLGLAIILLMFGFLAAHLYRDLTDRPYLAVELRGDMR